MQYEKRKSCGVQKTRTKLNAVHMGKARSDAAKFLNLGQWLELEDIAERLEDLENPREIWDLQIEPMS